jgi:hypothetical protein
MPHDVALLATIPTTLSQASSSHFPHCDELLTPPLVRVASVDLTDQLLGEAKCMHTSIRGNGKLFCSRLGE